MKVEIADAGSTTPYHQHAAWAFLRDTLYVLRQGHHFELYQRWFPDDIDELMWSMEPDTLPELISGDVDMGAVRVFDPETGERIPLDGLHPALKELYFDGNFHAVVKYLNMLAERVTKTADRILAWPMLWDGIQWIEPRVIYDENTDSVYFSDGEMNHHYEIIEGHELDYFEGEEDDYWRVDTDDPDQGLYSAYIAKDGQVVQAYSPLPDEVIERIAEEWEKIKDDPLFVDPNTVETR